MKKIFRLLIIIIFSLPLFAQNSACPAGTYTQLSSRDTNGFIHGVQCINIATGALVSPLMGPTNIVDPVGNFSSAGFFAPLLVNVNNGNFFNEMSQICGACGGQFGIAGMVNGSSTPNTLGGFGVVGIGIANATGVAPKNQQGGGEFLGDCQVNNCQVWGIQPNVSDKAGLTTGVTLIGSELDVRPSNATTAYTAVNGYQVTMAANSHAGDYGRAFTASGNTTTGTRWIFGYDTFDGAASIGLNLGALTATANSLGQPIQLWYRDAGNTPQAVTAFQVDNTGSVVMPIKQKFNTDGRICPDETATTYTVFSSDGSCTDAGYTGFASSLADKNLYLQSAGTDIVFKNQGVEIARMNNTGSLGGSGIKHQRFTGVLGGTCPTGAAIGATCTSAAKSWTTAFADANYTVTCSLVGAMTGQPHIVAVSPGGKVAASITIQIAADTAAAANVAAAGTVDCIAFHD